MEEVLAGELQELREEQHRLEEELGHTALGTTYESRRTSISIVATETTLESQRSIRRLTEENVGSAEDGRSGSLRSASLKRNGGAATLASTAAVPVVGTITGSASRIYQQRLTELESLKRKYEAYARKTMSEYFQSVGDYQGYKERREKTMRCVRPFTFEARELLKSQRGRTKRQARESGAEECLRPPYKATPVPPTTFMNKYELMVEEWCQRKAAIEMMSRERARLAKEEAAFVQLSAQGLRHTREELMGVVYGADGKPVTRNELRRRKQTADAKACRRSSPGAVPRDVPVEVRMKLWPAISDHERVRRERLKFLATVRKTEVDAEVRQVMPLLTSPSPTRCYDTGNTLHVDVAALLNSATGGATGTGQLVYGIGQAVLPPKPAPVVGATTGTTATVAPAMPSAQPPTAAAGVAVPLAIPAVVPPPPQPPTAVSVPPPPPVQAAAPSPPLPAPPQPPTTGAVGTLSAIRSVATAVPSPPLVTTVPLPPGGVPPVQPPPPPPPSSEIPTGQTARSVTIVSPTAVAPVPGAASPVVPGVGAAPADAPHEPITAAVADPSAKPAAPARESKENEWRRYNPQLTFKPNVRPGVPNFSALWAQNQMELLEKKQQRPTTVPKPFHLTPSSRDGKVVGRKPARSVSALSPPRRKGSPSGALRNRSPASLAAQENKRTVSPSTRSTAPRGTRAHALRTQAIYSNYVEQAEEPSAVTDVDDEYWKVVKQRQREVRKRLSAYLVDHHAEHERTITEKVAALRAAMKDTAKAAEERLQEMQKRVAAMPPVFAEPMQLNEVSKARAETEKRILKSLRETGLDGATIRSILASPPVSGDAAVADGATSPIKGEDSIQAKPTEGGAAPAEKSSDARATAAPPTPRSGSPKSARHSSRSSSSSGSSSSDSSDSSTSTGSSGRRPSHLSSAAKATPLGSTSMLSAPVPKPVTPKKSADYSDDSFESSDSD